MKQSKVFVVLVVSALIFGCNGVEVFSKEKVSKKPSRSECIIGIYFSDDGKYISTENELSQIVERVIEKLNAISKNKGSEIYPSMSMNWETSILYVQFPHKCEERFNYGKEALSSIDIGSFKYEFVHGEITPSINTIDVSGPYWSR